MSSEAEERPENEGDETPWTSGQHLKIRAQGILASHDEVRRRIVGRDGNTGTFRSQVTGSRAVRTKILERHCDGTRNVFVGSPQGAPRSEDATAPGSDTLDVHDDARLRHGNRILLMNGTLRRTHKGGMIKAASMEGVMCAGTFVRVLAGPSATVSPLGTADTYGGSARIAATRANIAALHYRSCAGASYAYAALIQNAGFIIEPLTSPAAKTPKGKAAEKMARLAKVAGAARMVCPMLDIGAGVVGAGVGIGVGAFKLIRRAVKGPAPRPPVATAPRIHNKNHGLSCDMVSSILHL